MRKMLFRGKRKKGDKRWVEGDLTHGYADYVGIVVRCCAGTSFEVAPETVGQYTGLTDKNGTKIFEGDIVQYELHDIRNTAAIKYGAPKEESFCYGWYLDDNNGNTAFLFCKNWVKDYNCQVIGNIYDNPELLGGENNG